MPLQRQALVVAAILMVVALPCQAVDYSLGGNLRVEANHDSNLLLQEAEESASGQVASALVSMGAATPTTSADLDVTLSSRHYNVPGFDSDDQRASGRLRHTMERSAVGIELGLVRDSTLTSELLDSGRVGSAGRHEQYTIAPYYEYQVGERDLLTFNGSYADSRYAEAAYIDYTYWNSALLWRHMFTERFSAFSQVLYSAYESDSINGFAGQSYFTESKELGAQIGGEYLISETLSLSLLGGRSKNKTQPTVSDPNNICPFASASGLLPLFPLCTLEDTDASLTTLNGSLSWTSPRNTLSASALRRTQPSSAGYLQINEQFDLQWKYQLFEHGSISAKATVGNNEVSERYPTERLNPSREYQYTTLSYAHRVTETWSVLCSYQYRTQKYEERDRVESHVGMLAIVWKPQEKHWSR